MGFLDHKIGNLLKPITALPIRITGQGEWLKRYFDGNAEQIRDAHDGLVDYINGNVYTKEETVDRINAQMIAIGAGDMAKSVYDTDGDGKVDAAEYADTAATATEATHAATATEATHAATATEATTANSAKNGWWLYQATLTVAGWEGNGPFNQWVDLEKEPGAPEYTLSVVTTPPMFNATESEATNRQLQQTLGLLLRGGRYWSSGNRMRFRVFQKPTSDITVYMLGRMPNG